LFLRPWAKINSFLLRKASTPASLNDSTADYALRSDWSQSDGRVNYSSFVYFDLDRDGRYGTGDRPLSAIRVRLKKNNEVVASIRTNNNGFANFRSSLTDLTAPISIPGIYEFAVSVPAGFNATSDNIIQKAEFQVRPGSIAGIRSDEMLQPVGLAPNKIIRGRIFDNAALSIKALQDSRSVDETEFSNQSTFEYPVPTCADAVEVSSLGLVRRVPVSDYPIDLGLLDPNRGTLTSQGTETIDFEGINPRGLRKIPSGYAGLDWFNLNSMARDFTKDSEGYVNGNTSGDFIAYTSSGYPALIYSPIPFDFIGVHLSIAWLKAEGEDGIIESWRGDRLVAKDRVKLSALAPVFYCPCLPGITRIRLMSEHYWQMVLDDLVIGR